MSVVMYSQKIMFSFLYFSLDHWKIFVNTFRSLSRHWNIFANAFRSLSRFSLSCSLVSKNVNEILKMKFLEIEPKIIINKNKSYQTKSPKYSKIFKIPLILEIKYLSCVSLVVSLVIHRTIKVIKLREPKFDHCLV